ncbi:DUF1302 domain-containing protein [Pseudomonas sp. 13B_2.1_Bac1]|uniref:DUF1302 domain-containing protein n=1 Tax=Pseudomonas sp. 13B_2.1_Bac1 TaxID=2971624 RepID=UPI0021C925F5|nr:DUF1302 domain-containing protein [Pseudomonas sp. 13B_2.1_Bac1]MCU1785184.1 DUF1302 domain-containing protein [Pseudomonas sp. 13B_2.1_Bac1]
MINLQRNGVLRPAALLLSEGRHVASWQMAFCSALALAVPAAQAMPLADTESYSLRFDNSIKYSLGVRTESPSHTFLDNPNGNDGDARFDSGSLITNRLDLLSELDFSLKDAYKSGFRVSAAAWYDNVYAGGAKNVGENYNPDSVSSSEFVDRAKRLHGHDAEILDAFVHSGVDIAGHDLNFRLGRHTLLWGQSLFRAGNGIAYGQAPIDVIKAASVPGTQAKELFLPVNQLSTSFALSDSWNIEAYYQFESRESRIPVPGTYWSPVDMAYRGGERLLTGGGTYMRYSGSDEADSSDENWGVALKYYDLEGGWDVGFYYVKFADRLPQVVTSIAPGVAADPFQIGEYRFVTPTDIDIVGMSFSTTLLDANVGAEISVRNNMPLVSAGYFSPDSHSQFATGDTVHGQVSMIWVTPRTGFWDSASVAAEAGIHHLYSKDDPSNVYVGNDKTAYGVTAVFEPSWLGVRPSLDLSMPITVAHNFTDTSPIDPTWIGDGGSVSVGLNFNYQRTWRGGVAYTMFTGADSTNVFADRDNLMFTVSRSF